MAAAKKTGGNLAAFMEKARPQTAPPAPARSSKQVTTNGAAPRGKAAARAESGRRALTDGREQLLIYLQPQGIRELKLAVLDGLGHSVSAIAAEALNEWLQKQGRPPVA